MLDMDKVSSALCDMYDIREALSTRMKNKPKDNDGTEITIGDCINDVILFLEELEECNAENP